VQVKQYRHRCALQAVAQLVVGPRPLGKVGAAPVRASLQRDRAIAVEQHDVPADTGVLTDGCELLNVSGVGYRQQPATPR